MALKTRFQIPDFRFLISDISAFIRNQESEIRNPLGITTYVQMRICTN
jgi:hypothetical protein